MDGYSHSVVRQGGSVRYYYDIAGSPYILEAYTPGKSVSTMKLCDLSGRRIYDLTNPEDRVAFLVGLGSMVYD